MVRLLVCQPISLQAKPHKCRVRESFERLIRTDQYQQTYTISDEAVKLRTIVNNALPLLLMKPTIPPATGDQESPHWRHNCSPPSRLRNMTVVMDEDEYRSKINAMLFWTILLVNARTPSLRYRELNQRRLDLPTRRDKYEWVSHGMVHTGLTLVYYEL